MNDLSSIMKTGHYVAKKDPESCESQLMESNKKL